MLVHRNIALGDGGVRAVDLELLATEGSREGGPLVFVPLEWQQLDSDHLLDAIADFAQRDRRFGGLDL